MKQRTPTSSKDLPVHHPCSQSVNEASIASGYANMNSSPCIILDKVRETNSSTRNSDDGINSTLPNSQCKAQSSPVDSCSEYDSAEAIGVSEASDTSSDYFGVETNWDDDIDDRLVSGLSRGYTISGCKFQVNDGESWKDYLETDLTPLRHTLVERIMKEFWVIFNQEWTANVTSHAHTPSTSSPTATQSGSMPTLPTLSPTSSRKRLFHEEDEDSPGDDERKNPKRPKLNHIPSEGEDKAGFACPFRKHNPRKYDISSWRSCALSQYNTIARLK